MPPRRSARISSTRGRGRGRGHSAPSRDDPPPPPPPAENQEEMPDVGDSGVPVAETVEEDQSAHQTHEEDLVDTDDETVETDNAAVNRELLRYLRGQSGGTRKPVSTDFINAGMKVFEGQSDVDPCDAEHWLKRLQRAKTAEGMEVLSRNERQISVDRGDVDSEPELPPPPPPDRTAPARAARAHRPDPPRPARANRGGRPPRR
ncbi:hypothetical protein V6N11_063138 [Hibiscus sabdariffa]|uniref:Uncharacterized protein n=1 Tax=Hibiscus sabdariffa TaxID=183260 RepID=A0ABR2ADU7_9ROSI